MRIRIDTSGALDGLDTFGRNVRSALEGCFSAAAGDMEQYAKENRPWTDRTGNARRTLEGVCGTDAADILSVGVEGHMPYSPILELGYDGRFAILAPTVRHFAPDILLGAARSIRDGENKQ